MYVCDQSTLTQRLRVIVQTFQMLMQLYMHRASFCAFQAVGYEYAVEMTYPLPEGISAGLLNALSQVGVVEGAV